MYDNPATVVYRSYSVNSSGNNNKAVRNAETRLTWFANRTLGSSLNILTYGYSPIPTQVTGLCSRPARYKVSHSNKSRHSVSKFTTPYLIIYSQLRFPQEIQFHQSEHKD